MVAIRLLKINSLIILATYKISEDEVYKGFKKSIDSLYVFIWVPFFYFIGRGVYSLSLSNVWGSLLALSLHRG